MFLYKFYMYQQAKYLMHPPLGVFFQSNDTDPVEMPPIAIVVPNRPLKQDECQTVKSEQVISKRNLVTAFPPQGMAICCGALDCPMQRSRALIHFVGSKL